MCLVAVDPLPVNLTPPSIHIDFRQRKEALLSSFPNKSNNPENDDDGNGEHDLEETWGSIDATAKWPDSNVELSSVRDMVISRG